MLELDGSPVGTFNPGTDTTLSQLGADLRDFVRSRPEEWIEIDLRDLSVSVNDTDLDVRSVGRWEKALRTLESARPVSIAVVSATSSHIAWEIALACDFRVVDDEPEIPWSGLSAAPPGMWLYRLIRLVGRANTRRILYAKSFPQLGWAKCVGLVDEVSPEVNEATASFRTKGTDSVAFKLRSQLMTEADEVSYEQALGVHLAAVDRTLRQNSPRTHDV